MSMRIYLTQTNAFLGVCMGICCRGTPIGRRGKKYETAGLDDCKTPNPRVLLHVLTALALLSSSDVCLGKTDSLYNNHCWFLARRLIMLTSLLESFWNEY
jgi:hypothetical protein